MSVEAFCGAIRERHLVRFYYSGDKALGFRVVEPHMIAYNSLNSLVLSAWFLSGPSESNAPPGWREYLISAISQVTEMQQQFAWPRQGYAPGGGTLFHNVVCEL
jgi:hypothetical protein